jgi:iron complex transport system substrate-binding protein
VRICSLVPAATEALFAIGLGDRVVGVTHECDFPPEAAMRLSVTASALDLSDLTSAEIDRAVSESVLDGRPLYAIDEAVWGEIEPDIVVTQELCAVCAVSRDEVAGVVTARGVDAELLDFSPATLNEVLTSIVGLGTRLGADGAADELTAGMRSRLERVRAALAEVETSPRVFFCEWLEPPYVGGHWVPDMISLAGGTDVAGMVGEPSFKIRWEDVAAREPDVVVIAPCGFDLDRTLEEVIPLELSAHLLGTPARQESRVFAVDGNAYFSRAGPRLVDGVELLAFLLHPEAYSDQGLPWSRIRL